MPMALGMKDISNLGYMHCTTAVSLEMSDEPIKSLCYFGRRCTNLRIHLNKSCDNLMCILSSKIVFSLEYQEKLKVCIVTDRRGALATCLI